MSIMVLTAQEHIPVMLREVIDALAPRQGGIYVDGTFGRGSYTRALLEAGAGQVVGIDRDPEAIQAGQQMLGAYGPRLRLLHGNFGDMRALLAQEDINGVDGVALDIGVSSPQIDQADRGFSFQEDGPLDMRMSREGQTAADIVNTSSESDLANIIYTYGEERFSRRIAKRIVETRAVKPFSRTTELAALIRDVVPRSKDGVDPATRSFQALRIAVNDELGELERGLAAAEAILKPQGRLAVVSFHSLEDRCVKAFMRRKSGNEPNSSRHTPGMHEPSQQPTFSLITRKALSPDQTECLNNPRARSARLRVAERTVAPCATETLV